MAAQEAPTVTEPVKKITPPPQKTLDSPGLSVSVTGRAQLHKQLEVALNQAMVRDFYGEVRVVVKFQDGNVTTGVVFVERSTRVDVKNS